MEITVDYEKAEFDKMKINSQFYEACRWRTDAHCSPSIVQRDYLTGQKAIVKK